MVKGREGRKEGKVLKIGEKSNIRGYECEAPESTRKENGSRKEPHVVPADLHDWRSAAFKLFSAVIRGFKSRGWRDLTRQCLVLGKG